jgi:hypothetical protein
MNEGDKSKLVLCWLLRTSVQENRPVVHDEGGFLANASEMRVPSTWSTLRMRSEYEKVMPKTR